MSGLSINPTEQQLHPPAVITSSDATFNLGVVQYLQAMADGLSATAQQPQTRALPSVDPGEQNVLHDIHHPIVFPVQQRVARAEDCELTDLEERPVQQPVQQQTPAHQFILPPRQPPVQQPIQQQPQQEQPRLPFDPLPTLQPAFSALPPHALDGDSPEAAFHGVIKIFLRGKTRLHQLEYVSAAQRQAVHDQAHEYAAEFVEEEGLKVWPSQTSGRGKTTTWPKVRLNVEWSVIVDQVAAYIRVFSTLVAPDIIADAVDTGGPSATDEQVAPAASGGEQAQDNSVPALESNTGSASSRKRGREEDGTPSHDSDDIENEPSDSWTPLPQPKQRSPPPSQI
ncbi:hypothetical protein B0A48_16793 [Cryoendolithus antarcticus]|uniref:Uncharacterized protein n=1 Tax=Cryoendolithus antarcticus TaxID=1507870 RepID=A0A1V8SEK1_9PEZI|nr:hypothetical protein B0A48_16793 [Cryoendolithus antarcticus]